MFKSLGTGDISIIVDQSSSRRMFKQVKYYVELSHELQACVNVPMHMDIFREMNTRIGTGDILVRMLGSWEQIMVDQRSSRRIFKQVKHHVISIELSHDLHACVKVHMHIDIFSGIYTSLGTGDILVRMYGSWEKIMVDHRRSRRNLKQGKDSVIAIELSHDLHACVNVLIHIEIFSGIYTSLGTGDILVRMCGGRGAI